MVLRFLSFSVDRQHTFGAVIENRIVDLGRRMSGYETLRDVIAAGALVRARDIAAESSADFEMKEISFAAPVPNPGKIVCIEHNYTVEREQEATGSNSSHPMVYLRTPESLVGHRQPLLLPLESHQLDCQGELALIIGRGGRRIAPAKAVEHIAGLTLANDGTIADWTRHGSHSVTTGKNFVSTGSIGPWMVTTDQFPDLAEIELTTSVNGSVRQRGVCAGMRYPVDYLVSYLSTFMPLNPGDVILTGALARAGAEMDPPAFLMPEDSVEISSDLIGKLTNIVAAETPPDDAGNGS